MDFSVLKGNDVDIDDDVDLEEDDDDEAILVGGARPRREVGLVCDSSTTNDDKEDNGDITFCCGVFFLGGLGVVWNLLELE